MNKSPSSRRAWVEIEPFDQCNIKWCVALLAEGVGRNLLLRDPERDPGRRPPRGGRG